MEALRIKDVAKALGVSVQTIHRWRANGYLPAPIMLGSTPVWDKDELTEWAKSKREVRQ